MTFNNLSHKISSLYKIIKIFFILLEITMFDRWGLFNANYGCPLCNRLHAIRQCSRFQVMNIEQKLRAVAHHGLCMNCLAQSHQRRQCSSENCHRCYLDHHSLLHPLPKGKIWFQMTAEVRVITWPRRRAQVIRVLIDPNAARSSILSTETRRLCCVTFHHRTTLTIFHRVQEKRRIEVDCAIEDGAYGYNPEAHIERQVRRKSSLAADEADRDWYEKSTYSMVLGADVMKQILIGPAKKLPGHMYSQETIFGQTYFGEGKLVGQ